MRSPLIASTALVLGTAGLGIALTPLQLVRVFPDDAFFYMKTAQNLADGVGSTFDGVNRTNGYHPLYLWLLAVVSRVVPLRGAAGLYAVMFVDSALAVLWLFIADSCARALAWSRASRAMLVAVLAPFALAPDFGTEIGLLLVLAWLLIRFTIRNAGRSDAFWQAGLTGAAIVLARLDAVVFVLAVGGSLLASLALARRTTWRQAALLLGPALAATALVALYNLHEFGHATTVSSWLKFGLDEWRKLPGNFAGAPVGIRISLVLTAAIGVVAMLRALIDPSAIATVFGGLGCWSLTYTFVMFAFIRGGPEYWYFPLPISIGGFLLVERLRGYVVDRAPVVRIAAVLLAFSLGASSSMVDSLRQLRRGWLFDDSVKIGLWVDEHLPADARIFQVDNSGVVAYFANRSVINGDGLINGWEFQDFLRRGELSAYLAQHRVEYFIWDQFRDGKDVRIPVPLWSSFPVEVRFNTPPEVIVRAGRFVLVRSDSNAVSVVQLQRYVR